MLSKAISIAKKKAAQSTCKYSVAAIGIDRKGRVLGTSRNLTRFNHKGGSIHAEMNLMKKFDRKLKTIIIFRVTPGGEVRRMDACPVCAAKAKELGISIKSLV